MDYLDLDEEKARVVIKNLKNQGWRHIRSKGSHHIFKHADSPETITVPAHSMGDEISPGVHRIIKKQSATVGQGKSVSEDAGAVGTTSAVPAVNTQSTGEAEIAANPPVKKRTNLLKRSAPGVPRTLRQIISKEK